MNTLPTTAQSIEVIVKAKFNGVESDLAVAMGVSRQFVNDLAQSTNRNLRIKTLNDICRAADIPISTFFSLSTSCMRTHPYVEITKNDISELHRKIKQSLQDDATSYKIPLKAYLAKHGLTEPNLTYVHNAASFANMVKLADIKSVSVISLLNQIENQ